MQPSYVVQVVFCRTLANGVVSTVTIQIQGDSVEKCDRAVRYVEPPVGFNFLNATYVV